MVRFYYSKKLRSVNFWKYQTPTKIDRKSYSKHICISKNHHDSQTQDFLSRKVCVLALNKKFYIREDIFRVKTPGDQNKYFVKFLNSNVSFPTPSSVYVTSIDGTYAVINKAARVAKKPGQRKRPVNAKTSKRHYMRKLFVIILLFCFKWTIK